MFIVDIETTGLNGIRAGDKIVEVGVVKLTPEGIEDVYQAVVNQPDIENYADAWVFQHTDLTVEDVRNGVPEEEVILKMRHILNGKFATSYNTPFDFDKFLMCWPWAVNPIIPFDIMDLATDFIRPPYDGWIRSEVAYNVIFPEDQPGLGEKQSHRALDDARREAYILLGCLGLYQGVE